MNSVLIDDYNISTLNSVMLLEEIQSWAQKRKQVVTTTLNLEMIARGVKDRSYKSLIQKSDLIIADGMPLVWYSKIFRENKIKERITGTDLTEAILRKYSNHGVAVIGGINPAQALQNVYPNIDKGLVFINNEIIDSNNQAQLDDICSNIKDRGIYFVFVALGVPKQDVIARYIADKLGSVFVISVGGAFDLLGGLKPRAPKIMQDFGMEWFWRLLIEPKRLWKRYLLSYPIAIVRLVKCI